MAADPSYPNIVQFRQDGNLYVPTGKSAVVESGGTLDVSAGTLTLAAGQIASAALAAGAVNAAAIGAGAVTAAGLLDPTANNAIAPGLKCAHFHYDATVQSGVAGTVAIAAATLVPNNAIVLGGLMRVTTALVGTGASVALQLNAANDVVSAAAISGAPWSSTGLKAIVPVWTAATAILTTAARDLSAVITTATITAGVFDVFLFYITIA